MTAGETYFIGVFGKTSDVINNYSLSVVNTAAPEAPTLQFSNADYFVSDVGPEAVITVTRVGGLSGTSTVDYATGGGTAVAGVDYDPVSGTLTFAAGESTQSFIVPISSGQNGSGNKNLELILSNPTGADLGTLNTATLIIVGSSVIVIEDTTSSCNLSAGEPSSQSVWYLWVVIFGIFAARVLRWNKQ